MPTSRRVPSGAFRDCLPAEEGHHAAAGKEMHGFPPDRQYRLPLAWQISRKVPWFFLTSAAIVGDHISIIDTAFLTKATASPASSYRGHPETAALDLTTLTSIGSSSGREPDRNVIVDI